MTNCRWCKTHGWSPRVHHARAHQDTWHFEHRLGQAYSKTLVVERMSVEKQAAQFGDWGRWWQTHKGTSSGKGKPGWTSCMAAQMSKKLQLSWRPEERW